MARFEITTPVADYNGFSAGVNFTAGKAVVTSDTQAGMSALAYFRGAGYGILALDEVLVDEVLNRANEDPATEAARLRREIADLEDRESLDELRERRAELYAKVYGEDDPRVIDAATPRQEGEVEIQATLSPGSANYAEGDRPAETKSGEVPGVGLLAPPADSAPVAEWRAWAVDSGRATAEEVAAPRTKADIIATYGAAYDRDREEQLNATAGSDESGTAPREGDSA
jgi:hypothetical protein